MAGEWVRWVMIGAAPWWSLTVSAKHGAAKPMQRHPRIMAKLGGTRWSHVEPPAVSPFGQFTFGYLGNGRHEVEMVEWMMAPPTCNVWGSPCTTSKLGSEHSKHFHPFPTNIH